MSIILKLSGTSFNQGTINKLEIGNDVTLETRAINEDAEDLDGRGDPAIKCVVENELVGYVPGPHKDRVRELIKNKHTFKIHSLNRWKDNPTTGVRIISHTG